MIPRSNGSLSNLDQILALVGGVIVVLAAMRRAYCAMGARSEYCDAEETFHMKVLDMGLLDDIGGHKT